MNQSKHILAGLAAILTAGPAIGQQNPVVVQQNLPTAIISYADLDLTSPAGIAALNGRVRRAAEGLCANTGVVSLRERMDERSCVSFALGQAQGQIDTAIAQADNPRFASRRGTIVLAGR